MKSMQQEKILIKKENAEKTIANKNEIISMLAKHQSEERKLHKDGKEFIFEWEACSDEKVEINNKGRIASWLYPIKFNIDLAIIIEAIQRNVTHILTSRAKGLEMIYTTLKIEKEKFYTKIEEIQNLLIDFGKVKVCNNGAVILINEDYKTYINRRKQNENKEIFI